MPLQTQKHHLLSALGVLAILAGGFYGQLPYVYASSWSPTLLVNTEAFQVIDDTNSSADLYIQFGDSLNKRLTYDRTVGTFIFDDDLEVLGTASGRHIHAQDLLTSSGQTIIEGNQAYDPALLVVDQNSTTGSGQLIDSESTNQAGLIVDMPGINYTGDNGEALNPHILFGYNSAMFDVNLYRQAADVLKTDDSLWVKQTVSGSTIRSFGLTDCDNATTSKLLWDETTGKFSCGTDQSGGGGGSSFSGTGSLQAFFDNRYVETGGDTMTGGLLIDVGAGNESNTIDSGLALEVTGTASGRILHAQDLLTTSGSIVVEGNLTFGDAVTDTITVNAEFLSHLIPDADDTYDLGSSSQRWRDLYLGPASVHIGTDGNEATIGYDITGNEIEFDADGDATPDVVFEDTGFVGIGTEAPKATLDVQGSISGTTLDVNGNANVSGTLSTDTINEFTTNNGVTIDSFAIQDGYADASAIKMATTDAGVTRTVQDSHNYLNPAGRITGGGITDNGNGTVTVAAGSGYIRTSNADTAALQFVQWAQSGSIAIASGDTRYFGVGYRSGSPAVIMKTTNTWNYNTDFPLNTVTNDGGTMEVANNLQAITAAGGVLKRFYETRPLERDERTGGLIISETGTRNIAVTAGALWARLSRVSVSAIDTSGADTFDRYYSDGASGFTKESAQTQWNNTQYDDGSGTLQTMTNNRYSVQWFYIETDGDLVSVYGNAQYTTAAAAEAAEAPDSVPDRLTEGGKLIGRIIFQKDASSASAVQNVFGTEFPTTLANDHGNLSGLADDDHTQYALLAGRSGGQTLIGGTGAGENLTFNSTSDGTKGKLFFGSSAAFDEVNTRLGIGTTAPDTALEVVGTVSGSTLHAQDDITSSGSLVVENSFFGAGLSDCDTASTSKLLWDTTTGTFSCGTDTDTDTHFSGTGSLQAFFDNRYVETAGDTMTGGLIIESSSAQIDLNLSSSSTGVTIQRNSTGFTLKDDMYVSGPNDGTERAMSFDGTGDYVGVTVPSTDPTDFTMAAWIYPDSLSSYRTIMDAGLYRITLLTSDNKLTYMINGTGFTSLSATSLSTGTWQHVAVTRSGNDITFYINGVADANTYTNATDSSAFTIIRTGLRGDSSQGWIGEIDDSRFYNVALSAGEISTIYNSGSGTPDGKTTDLILHWKYDEASGNVTDFSGNSYTGALSGNATRVSSSILTSVVDKTYVQTTLLEATSNDDTGIYGQLNVGSSSGYTVLQGNKIQFFSKGVENMRLTSGGLLGIGTTTPTTELEIVGTLSGSSIHAQDDITSSGSLVVENSFFGAGLSDCDTSSVALQWDATTGTFSCGSAGGLTESVADARYVEKAGDTMTGALVIDPDTDTTGMFRINDVDGGNPVFNVDSTNERVGIGTASPAGPLHVVGATTLATFFDSTGSTNAVTMYLRQNGQHNDRAVITKQNDDHSSYPDALYIANAVGGTIEGELINENDGDWRFRSNQSDILMLKTGGNVGIGTTSPSEKLEVVGTASGEHLHFGRLLTGSGHVIMQNVTDAVAAFQIRDSSGEKIFNVNTLIQQVEIESTAANWSGALLVDMNTAAAGTGVMIYSDSTDSPGLAISMASDDAVDNPHILFGYANMFDTKLWRNTGSTLRTNGDFIVDGEIGIGTTSPTSELDVTDASASATIEINSASTFDSAIEYQETGSQRWLTYSQGSNDRFYILDADNDVAVYLIQNGTSWISGSDERLKENIEELSVLDRLEDFRAVSFDWKSNGKHDLGVIAQELDKVFPELVTKGSNEGELTGPTDPGTWGVDYAKIGPLALQGVKENLEFGKKLSSRLDEYALQLKQALADIEEIKDRLPEIEGNGTVLEISEGTIELNGTYHLVAAEEGDKDTLATLSGGTLNQTLVLQAAPDNKITVRKTGKILLTQGDYVLDKPGDVLVLLKVTDDTWVELSRTGGNVNSLNNAIQQYRGVFELTD